MTNRVTATWNHWHTQGDILQPEEYCLPGYLIFKYRNNKKNKEVAMKRNKFAAVSAFILVFTLTTCSSNPASAIPLKLNIELI